MTEFQSLNSLKKWFKNFNLKEKWGELLTGISPLLFSILFGFTQVKKYLGINWFLFIVAILALTSILAWLSTINNNDSLSQLRRKNSKLKDQKEHVEGILFSLPTEFSKLLSNKWLLQGDSRITIYRYTKINFIPVSRYSKDPDYDNINRESYPKDVGYISKCWAVEEGKYFNNLPDPIKSLREYIDFSNEETGMLKKDVKDLTMKSRSFYGKTLYDEDGKAFLIVMVESTQSEIANIDTIKKDLEGTLSEFIISIVKANITPGGGRF